MRLTAVALALIVTLLPAATPAASPPLLELRLSAAFAPAPATVRATVRLANPGSQDRVVILVYDGAQAGSSQVQCPCPKQLVFDKVLRDLPAGDYFVRATLVQDVEGEPRLHHSALATLVVTGGLRDP